MAILRENPILRRRSLNLGGHRTSVTMEDVFWARFKAVAKARGISPSALAKHVADAVGTDANLSSSLRCFVIEDALAEIGRLKRALPY
jgi:predicted DNA-binding ribbon-helix-helix protein